MMIYAILGILLALSVAGNAYQYHEHTKDAVKFGATEQLAKDTKGAADACTAGVDRLETDGKKRQTALDKALAGVAPKVLALQEASLLAGRAQPDDPTNLCASLARYLQGQVKAERNLK